MPAITMVVDGGWSKRSHGHSYNVNSGVGVIFGAATKGLLFIGVRNKYCSICAINARRGTPIPEHNCFRIWSGSSCSMEADIILEVFNCQSRSMVFSTTGLLVMGIVRFTMLLFLGCHHTEQPSRRWSVPITP